MPRMPLCSVPSRVTSSGRISDIDIMIDINPEADMSAYDYAGLKRYIANLFGGRVDVVDREALKPRVRPPAEGDAVYAF